MGIVLTVKGDFHIEDIWFGVLWDSSSDSVIAYSFSFHQDSIFAISKPYPKVFAVRIWALEVISNDINCFIVWGFYRPV
jgi:hypothetical protein